MGNTDPPRGVEPDENATKVAWIERSVLVLLFVGLLIGAAAILKPFTTAILFGAILASAAWPLRVRLVRAGLGRGKSASLLLLLSIALIALPTLFVAPHLSEQLSQGTQQMQGYFSSAPAQPVWLAGIALVGDRLVSVWDHAVQAQGNIHTLVQPYAADLQQTMIAAAQALGDSIVQVILSLAVATMFWVSGDELVLALHRSLQRLGGEAADHVIDVAGGAVRSVASGVVGTAALQAVLMAIGLALAGVPGSVMLGFITLLLALSQIGGPLLMLIWGGGAWWLFSQDQQVWGIFMIIWGLMVSTVDNFVKPWLIGFGIQRPMSLTILGVFGGFIAFGFLGLFIGPTLLAVIYTLLKAWHASGLPAMEGQG